MCLSLLTETGISLQTRPVEYNMSAPARSLVVYGVYLLLVSISIMILPNFVLSLLGIPSTAEVWVRVAGMLALFLAFYDIQAGRNEIIPFIRWSVLARGSVIFFFGAFVLLGYVVPSLLLFGVVDAAAAIWTAITLRKAAAFGSQGERS